MTDTGSTKQDQTQATDPHGPTGALATWAAETTLNVIPDAVLQRAKHLLLDGIGCLLVGSHLEWSSLGVQAITDFDPGGDYMIAAWGGKKTSAYSAAMLNSSFIQGFELDDYYPAAPLHSNSILIPAMLPILEKHPELTGGQFLLALVLGHEVGTRIGLALHGPGCFRAAGTRAWFLAALRQPSRPARLELSPAYFEDAIGIASTQACGLMSAQCESMIKRMQHSFAARNGLYGAVLAQRGYVGIKRVLQREYGGFLPFFGEGHNPDPSQVTTGLGTRWTTAEIAVKPYAAMGGLHAGIDAALALRAKRQIVPDQVKSILIEVGDAAFSHGGFCIQKPIEPITAQMSLRYSIAVALLDGAALLKQFSHARINADDVWDLIGKIDVHKAPAYDQKPHTGYTTQVTILFQDGSQQQRLIETPTGGAGRPLTNDEIVTKFVTLVSSVTSKERIGRLQELILSIDRQEKAAALLSLLNDEVTDALA